MNFYSLEYWGREAKGSENRVHQYRVRKIIYNIGMKSKNFIFADTGEEGVDGSPPTLLEENGEEGSFLLLK